MIVEWLVYVCVCVIMVIRAGAIILQNLNFLAKVKILQSYRAPEKEGSIRTGPDYQRGSPHAASQSYALDAPDPPNRTGWCRGAIKTS